MTRNRYQAVFLCAAIGDILGKPVEGWKPQHISRYVGHISRPLGVIAAPESDEDGKIPLTLYMFLKYWDDPLAGLLRLVNFGGDSDSTAALYGALAGARDGIFVPADWLQILEGREALLSLADRLCDLRGN